MTFGRSIAAAWLLISVTLAPAAADDDIRARARAAVSQNDVQSTLEYGNISELDWLNRFDSGGPAIDAGPANVDALGSTLLYTGIAVAVILVLLTIYRLAFDRPVVATAGLGGLQAAGSSDDAAADQWLGDADELAGEGRWTEAIHALLLSAIRRLSDEFGRPKASRTSRELLRHFQLDDSRRTAFRQLITAVEAVIFGGRAPGAEEYAACREYAATIRGAST
jgi:hypothetical protein